MQELWCRDYASAAVPDVFRRNSQCRKGMSAVPCEVYPATDKRKSPSPRQRQKGLKKKLFILSITQGEHYEN